MSNGSLPEIAGVGSAIVVRVVSAVGVAVGGYKLLVEGIKNLGSGQKFGENIDPENLAVGAGIFAIGCVGWWVADKLADLGSPHMQRAEASRLNGLQSHLAR